MKKKKINDHSYSSVDEGINSCFSKGHLLNAREPILTLRLIVTSFKDSQSVKAQLPISITDDGIFIFSNDVHP